jgi:adenine-specific DNA-methyltransferase
LIKYIGSKRTLIPVLGDIAQAVEAKTAVDLFTGTTRVAQEFKRRGIEVTAADIATYSEVLAKCYVEADSTEVDKQGLLAALEELMALPPSPGYFTKTFCEQSRYFQPKNGARVDAMRDHLEARYSGSPLFPILLTSLMLAADRIDSTTGVQMAYLKGWAPRAHNDIELRMPDLLPGPGHVARGNALDLARMLPRTDLAYLDPPYNQHRYFTNYHIWETLVRWDEPDHYGIACKRIDSRDESTKSVFNKKREMPLALRDVIRQVNADVAVVSYNDESWVTAEQMMDWLSSAGYADVRMLAYDRKRYVGAQIGIYNPSGHKVGKVSHLRNIEYVFVAGSTDKVEAAAVAAGVHARAATADTLF